MKQENNSLQKNENGTIDFIGIWKRAGTLIWQNRFLIWFGILMALGSPGSMNYSYSPDNAGEKEKAAQDFLSGHWKLAIVLAAVMLVLGIVIFLISLAGRAGLIRSVHSLALGRPASFRAGWKEGRKYIGRLLKIIVIFFLATLLLVLILAVPIVYLLATQSWIGAILIGLLAIAIFVPLVFIMSFTAMFAEFYVVLSGLSVWSAIEAGYNLFLKNILNSLIFGLLSFAVSIVGALVMLPVVGVAFVLLAPAGMLFYFLNKMLFGLYMVFAILLFALIILFASSIFVTLTATAKVLFFKEIAQIKTEEEVKEAEKNLEEGVAPVRGQA